MIFAGLEALAGPLKAWALRPLSNAECSNVSTSGPLCLKQQAFRCSPIRRGGRVRNLSEPCWTPTDAVNCAY